MKKIHLPPQISMTKRNFNLLKNPSLIREDESINKIQPQTKRPNSDRVFNSERLTALLQNSWKSHLLKRTIKAPLKLSILLARTKSGKLRYRILSRNLKKMWKQVHEPQSLQWMLRSLLSPLLNLKPETSTIIQL